MKSLLISFVFLILTPFISFGQTPVFKLIGPSEVCEGMKTRYVFTGSDCPYLQWAPSGGTIVEHVSDFEKLIVFSYSGQAQVTVNYTCTVSGTSYSGAENIVVNKIHPKPVVSITPSASEISYGESVVLTATGAASYVWSGGGINMTGNSIVVTPTATPSVTYTVIGSSDKSCSSSPTSVTITVKCEVNPGIARTFCKNNSYPNLTVLNNPSPAGGNWSGAGIDGNGNLSGSLAEGDHVFTYTYTIGNCTSSKNVTVSIIPNTPPADPTVSSTSYTVCQGQNVAVSASHVDQGQGGVFKWYDKDDNLLGTGTTYNFQMANMLPNEIKVSYTSPTACESAKVKVNFVPANGGTISGGTTVCTQATGVLTASIAGTISGWQRSYDNGTTWNYILDNNNQRITGNSYNYSEVSSSLFRVIVNTGSCLVESETEAVNIIPTSGGYINVLYSKKECGNVEGTLSVTGFDGEVDYWMKSSNGGPFSIISETEGITENTNYNFKVTEPTQFKAIVTTACGVSESTITNIKTTAFGGSITKIGTTDCRSATGRLTLTNHFGDVDHWEKSEDDGVTWSIIESVLTSYQYNDINKSTKFRTAIKLSPCSDITYSTEAFIEINIPNPGVLVQTESIEDLAERCAQGTTPILKGSFKLTNYTSTAIILGWEKSNNGINWTSASGVGDKVEYEVMTTTFFRAKLYVPGCGNLNSGEAIVHVNKPSLGEQFVQGEVIATYEGYSYSTGGSIILGKGFNFFANSCQEFTITINPNFTIDNQDKNFVLTEVIQKDNVLSEGDIPWLGANDKISTYQYFDGLGMPSQTVGRKASPMQKDIVTPVVIDKFGRSELSYLPYVSDSDDGHFKENAISSQLEFYTRSADKIANTPFPYAKSIYEASPANRVVEQGSPGTDWQPAPVIGGGKTVKAFLKVNTGEENIKIWEVVNNLGAYFPTSSASYAPGQLLISVTQDENDQQVKEYKDREGKVVLKEVQNGSIWLKTLYIYDYFNNLSFVIPPQGVANLPDPITDDFLKKWAFCYKYDEKQRLISKRVPGADWNVMIYDKFNRLVMTQDGRQRVNNKYSVIKYDLVGRPIINGEWSTALSQASIELEVLREDDVAEINDITKLHGYTLDHVFPTIEAKDVLTINYYDNYFFKSGSSFPGTGMDYIAELGNQEDENDRVVGLQTGTKIKVLEYNENSPKWLSVVSYFDNNYQVVQSISDNLLSGKDRTTNKYDFAGKLIATVSVHSANVYSPAAIAIKEEFTYDHQGRLLTHNHKINSGNTVTLSTLKYNELGQQIEKNLHKTTADFLQSIDYRYNIRGWLTNINNYSLADDGGVTNDDGNDQFGFELKYNDGLQMGEASPQYNGNISEIIWNSKRSQKVRGYSFTYDHLNRLKDALFKVKGVNGWTDSENGRYDEKILEYDLNGNIVKLERKGASGDGVVNGEVVKNFGDMDKLNYTYNGNQLISVKDEIDDILFRNPTSPNSTASIKGDDFSDNSTSNGEANVIDEASYEYKYDENGNKYVDKNKGITNIVYNILNLPQKVVFGEHGSIEYIYSATGVKLRKIVNSTNGTIVDYSGIYEYKDKILVNIATAEGRVIPVASNKYEYHYFLKDHLGNVRVAVDQDSDGKPRIIQEDHYYPFGMKLNGLSYDNGTGNKYLYNGKELQEDLGLNLYDYHARMMDPVLGRFTTMDPLMEKFTSFSPYNYCLNNPVLLIDPDGMLAKYNWHTKQYEDNGSAVSWLETQWQHGVGDFSGSVALFPGAIRSGSPDLVGDEGNGGVLNMLTSAQGLEGLGRIKVYQVVGAEDAADKLEKLPSKVSYLIIASHGGDDETSYFKIGGQPFRTPGEITDSDALKRISKTLKVDAEIVFTACNLGAHANGGQDKLKAAASVFKATVYGNQSFTPGSSVLFEGSRAYYSQSYLRSTHSLSILNPSRSPNAYRNAGSWTKVTKAGEISTIRYPYFDSFGKFRYRKDDN